MAELKSVLISSFLRERESRIKPLEANKMGLKRLSKIDFSGEIHLVEKPTNTDMILIKNGDLVISGINVEKGAIAVYQGNEDILATIHYSSYIFDKNKIDLEYLKLFLKSKSFKDIINSQTKNGIKTELKSKNFLPLQINLPDLESQIKIRNLLKNKLSYIEELELINDKSESYISKLRQQILQEAVQGKLVKQDSTDEPALDLLNKIKAEKEKLVKDGKLRKEKPILPISEEEIPYELPKSWEWCRLTNLSKEPLKNGYSPIEAKYPTNTKVLTLTATTSGKFNSNEFKFSDEEVDPGSDFWLKSGDILIQRGNSRDYVGISAIFNGEENEFIYPDLMIRLRIFKDLLDLKYINYVLQSPITRNYFQSIAKGTSSSMVKINQEIINVTLIPLPPLSEQKRIVEKVDQLMRLCDELEKQVKENKKDSEKLIESVLKENFESGQ